MEVSPDTRQLSRQRAAMGETRRSARKAEERGNMGGKEGRRHGRLTDLKHLTQLGRVGSAHVHGPSQPGQDGLFLPSDMSALSALLSARRKRTEGEGRTGEPAGLLNGEADGVLLELERDRVGLAVALEFGRVRLRFRFELLLASE